MLRLGADSGGTNGIIQAMHLHVAWQRCVLPSSCRRLKSQLNRAFKVADCQKKNEQLRGTVFNGEAKRSSDFAIQEAIRSQTIKDLCIYRRYNILATPWNKVLWQLLLFRWRTRAIFCYRQIGHITWKRNTRDYRRVSHLWLLGCRYS
jgi:hypothetical protein